MISARRRIWSGLRALIRVPVLGGVLLVELLAADLPRVHDRHDDRVAGRSFVISVWRAEEPDA